MTGSQHSIIAIMLDDGDDGVKMVGDEGNMRNM